MKRSFAVLVVALGLCAKSADAISLEFVPAFQAVVVGDSGEVALAYVGDPWSPPLDFSVMWMTVTFDPAILHFMQFVGPVDRNGASCTFAQESTAGVLNLKGTSCSGFEIGTVVFGAVGVGTTNLVIQDIFSLYDAASNDLAALVDRGTAEISVAVPEPGTGTLLLVGGFLLAADRSWRRRRGRAEDPGSSERSSRM